MQLRTRPARFALAGFALAMVASLAACSSNDADTPSASSTAASGESTSADTAGVNDTPPETPIGELLLAQGEAPAEGKVDVIPPADLQKQVDDLVSQQGRKLMEEPACDKVARLESVGNFGATEGVSAMVSYKESEQIETVHRFGLSMVSRKLDDFVNRGLYEACKSTVSSQNPNATLNMTVTDAPAAEGSKAFRVTSDLITAQPDGSKKLQRNITIHSFTRGTTFAVDYNAESPSPDANPVIEAASSTLDAIYVAQRDKILKAK